MTSVAEQSPVQTGMAILNTTVDAKTGRVFLQLGDVSGEVEADRAVLMQHVGYVSRASNPNPTKRQAAWTTVVREGDGDTVIATQDLRGLELAGNLRPGETAVYAAGADGTKQGRVLLKDDGSVTTFTTHDNTADGQSVYLQVAPDGLRFVAPWGTLTFDATGFHVLTQAGASFSLGGISGLPGPFAAIGSYAAVSAGSVNIESTATSLGGDDVPLANGAAVSKAIEALQTQIAAIVAGLSGNPTTSASVAGAAAQLAIDAAKVTAQLPQIAAGVAGRAGV